MPQNVPSEKIQWVKSKHGKFVAFFLSFVKNLKRHLCGKIFLNRTIILLHCLHFDSKVANIYKFMHLFGNLFNVCGVTGKPLYSKCHHYVKRQA